STPTACPSFLLAYRRFRGLSVAHESDWCPPSGPETNPTRQVWAPVGAFCFGSAHSVGRRGGIDHENGPARPFFCRSRLRKSRRVRTTAEKQRLIELLEPAVGALGFELVDIDL